MASDETIKKTAPKIATPIRICPDGMSLLDANGSAIAELGKYGEIKPWKPCCGIKHFAPQIVTAVNSHSKLVAALTSAAMTAHHSRPSFCSGAFEACTNPSCVEWRLAINQEA